MTDSARISSPTRRWLQAAACAGTLLLLAACSSPSSSSSPEHYLPESAALQSAVDCSAATGNEAPGPAPVAASKGRVPDGFEPLEVVRCTPDSIIATVTQAHLSGDYAPLLAALAKPSEREGPASCLDYGEILPAIWLVNSAGQAVIVQWPMDSCNHSLPGTSEALRALTVTDSITVSRKDVSH